MITGITPIHDIVTLRIPHKGVDYDVVMDWEDYEPLIGLNMYITSSGYVAVKWPYGKTPYSLLHKIITNTVNSGFDTLVDHKDMNKLNCRNGNLRICNKSQNEANGTIRSHNTTGYKGVYFSKHGKVNPFHAYARKDGKKLHLGCFHTAKEAALAYNKYVLEVYGEFARLNDVAN